MGYTEKNYVCACIAGFKGENCEKGILTREGYLGHSGFQVMRMIERGKNQNPKNPWGFQQKNKKIPRAQTKPKKIPCRISEKAFNDNTKNKNIRSWMLVFVYSSYHLKFSISGIVILTTVEAPKNIFSFNNYTTTWEISAIWLD